MRNLLAALQDSSVYRRRWVRFLVGFCFLIFSRSGAFAADPSMVSQYLRSEFTVDDGLPESTINSIIETEDGLLWIGTTSGLASFDTPRK
jgi:ligand-binding sensor domain-containing protein